MDLSKLTPSELLSTAIDDMELASSKGVSIRMRSWIIEQQKPTINNDNEQNKTKIQYYLNNPETLYDNICSVCLAGSVMLKSPDEDILKFTFGLDNDFNYNPGSISVSDLKYIDQYNALDNIRRGHINYFFNYLGYSIDDNKIIKDIVNNEWNGDKFPLKINIIHNNDEDNYFHSKYSEYKFHITGFKSLKHHGYDSRSWELEFDDFVLQMRELVGIIKEMEPLLMRAEIG